MEALVAGEPNPPNPDVVPVAADAVPAAGVAPSAEPNAGRACCEEDPSPNPNPLLGVRAEEVDVLGMENAPLEVGFTEVEVDRDNPNEF